jgi:hypothetical protein
MPAASRSKPQYVNPEVLQAYLTTVQSDVTEIKGTLAKLTDAVTGIERLETRQISLVSEIEAARKSQSSFEGRISAIEHDMPGLRELRKWVVGGMVTGIGMMLIAVASLVLYPRQYVVLTQQAPPKVSIEQRFNEAEPLSPARLAPGQQ